MSDEAITALLRQRRYNLRNAANGKCISHPTRDRVPGTLMCKECRAKRNKGKYIKEGWANVDWSKHDREIASGMGVTPQTVRYHRKLRSERPPVKFTYFMLMDDPERVKIGSTANVQFRRRVLSTQYGCALKVICLLPYAEWPEMAVHTMFQADWIEGEWFRYSDQMRKFVLNRAKEVAICA